MEDESIAQIIEEGGKVTTTEIREKDKKTVIVKIEPKNGKATISTTTQKKDDIKIDYSCIE